MAHRWTPSYFYTHSPHTSPIHYFQLFPLRYNPITSYYTYDSFTPPYVHNNGNIANSRILNGSNQVSDAPKLHGYPTVLRAKLYALLLEVQCTQNLPNDFQIFTNIPSNIISPTITSTRTNTSIAKN